MAGARLDFETVHTYIQASQPSRKFSIPIPDNVTSLTLDFEEIRAMAKENNPSIDEASLNTAIDTRTFYKISPINFNVPISEDEADILDHRLTTIDYNGITSQATEGDGLFSSKGRSTYYGAEIVKNLNINAKNVRVVGGAPNLKEFYGDIIVRGGTVTLFCATTNPITQSSLQKAVGTFDVSGVKEFRICTAGGDGKTYGAWFNVIDIRNVDTSKCTQMSLLNGYNTPCTIIVGNFSNESIEGGTPSLATLLASAPNRGRILVLTTAVPPKFKNCNFTGENPIDEYSKTFDWIAKGKFERILVPEDYRDIYINNTYIENGTVGKTGWSHYGPAGVAYGGKDIIRTYNPRYQYLPKKEGGENGRTVWIYRKANR